jgi:hypothetical protein
MMSIRIQLTHNKKVPIVLRNPIRTLVLFNIRGQLIEREV